MTAPGTGVVTPPSRSPAAAIRPPGANLPPIGVKFRRAHVWALGSLSVVAVVIGWLGRQRELLVAGDEPFYLTLSYSLAAGRYHDEFLVGAPPHVQYPPGMPTLLLLLRSLFGPDPDVARAVNLLFVVLTMLLITDLVRRISTPLAGVITVALVGLNPFILMRAGTLYAETLLMVTMASAVWAATMGPAIGKQVSLVEASANHAPHAACHPGARMEPRPLTWSASNIPPGPRVRCSSSGE